MATKKAAPDTASKAENTTQTLTIDGVDYSVADLSDNAKNQVVNLRVTDQEIASLKQKLAIAQTARVAYANALSAELPKVAPKTEH